MVCDTCEQELEVSCGQRWHRNTLVTVQLSHWLSALCSAGQGETRGETGGRLHIPHIKIVFFHTSDWS